jgi:hypothetical protein
LKVIAWGVGLTVVVTGILWLIWGSQALVPGLTFGLLGTAIQLAAAIFMAPAWEGNFDVFVRRWLVGMVFRMVGVVLVFVAIAVWPDLFPPLPTALGFLGVVIPLLFTEIRRFFR